MDFIACYHTFYVRDGQMRARVHYESLHAENGTDVRGKFWQRHIDQDVHLQYIDPAVEEAEENLDEILYASVT